MGAEQREQKSEPSHACERPAVQSQEDQGAAGARRYMYFLSCASRVVFARSSERARAGGGGRQLNQMHFASRDPDAVSRGQSVSLRIVELGLTTLLAWCRLVQRALMRSVRSSIGLLCLCPVSTGAQTITQLGSSIVGANAGAEFGTGVSLNAGTRASPIAGRGSRPQRTAKALLRPPAGSPLCCANIVRPSF